MVLTDNPRAAAISEFEWPDAVSAATSTSRNDKSAKMFASWAVLCGAGLLASAGSRKRPPSATT